MAVKRIIELTPAKTKMELHLYSSPQRMFRHTTILYETVVYRIANVTYGDYALVEHEGIVGWVLKDFIEDL